MVLLLYVLHSCSTQSPTREFHRSVNGVNKWVFPYVFLGWNFEKLILNIPTENWIFYFYFFLLSKSKINNLYIYIHILNINWARWILYNIICIYLRILHVCMGTYIIYTRFNALWSLLFFPLPANTTPNIRVYNIRVIHHEQYYYITLGGIHYFSRFLLYR